VQPFTNPHKAPRAARIADPERDRQKVQGRKVGLVMVGTQLRKFGVASFESFHEELSVLHRDLNSAGEKEKLIQ
jgi:hypothetical protein